MSSQNGVFNSFLKHDIVYLFKQQCQQMQITSVSSLYQTNSMLIFIHYYLGWKEGWVGRSLLLNCPFVNQVDIIVVVQPHGQPRQVQQDCCCLFLLCTPLYSPSSFLTRLLIGTVREVNMYSDRTVTWRGAGTSLDQCVCVCVCVYACVCVCVCRCVCVQVDEECMCSI